MPIPRALGGHLDPGLVVAVVVERHSSTPSACWEKSEKFVPWPFHVAPSG